VDPGEHDAALRRTLRLGQSSREFAPPSGLARHEQVRNFLAMCTQSKVVDAEARIEPKKRKKCRAGAWAIDLVRLSKKAPAGNFMRGLYFSQCPSHISTPGRPCFYLAVLIRRDSATLLWFSPFCRAPQHGIPLGSRVLMRRAVFRAH
jgi:hypothetical protein